MSTAYYDVYIAKGTYYPAGVQISTNRDTSFLLRRGIRLLGGHSVGGATRDIDANPTILSGDIGNLSDSIDNSYHVVVAASNYLSPSSADSVVLDGVTIARGAATGTGNKAFGFSTLSRASGGGLAIINTFTTVIRGCRFINNYASN